ncbi:pyridoxamine 5'-phosphate oxidase family protein [uncultured Draconibacterium sp.]|uniref:pyridoxamine 5'-phosphate oxidase family protein n=1 Tax=uncultured Draconibacterium sp. TaxID=1573823 RepID=UPI0025CDC554|nr:pyridoxamine 5'-phosphate oxidase family protein [uncultured Draconibacterium sp.]
MKKVLRFLKEAEVQYLATIGLDGKPKVRPFQFMFENDGKLWFCTGNTKAVYNELQKQPYVEFCASGQGMSWMRLKAKVVFADDLAIKAKVLEHSTLVKSIYKTPDNPSFEVFYLAEATASISAIGKSPEIVHL